MDKQPEGAARRPVSDWAGRRSHLPWRALTLLLVMLAGCGDRAPEPAGRVAAGRDGDSFLEDYLATLPAGPAAARPPIDGPWHGLALCPSGAFPVTLDVAGNRAVVTIEAAVGAPRRKTPFHHQHSGRDASVEYLPDVQRLTLVAAAGADASAPQQRDLQLDLLLVPDIPDRALLSVSERHGRNVRTCHTALAGRADEAAEVRAFAARLAGVMGDRRAVSQSDCPAEYAQWLADSAERGDEALLDPRFAAVFGAPYLALPVEQLLQASAILSGSCVAADDRRNGLRQTRLAAALRSHKQYQNAYSSHFREPLVKGWRAWADGRLAAGNTVDSAVLAQLGAVPVRFGLRDHPAFAGFNEAVLRQTEVAQGIAATTAFARRIEDNRDNFLQLLAVAMQAGSRDDVDPAVVGRGLDYYLRDAAARHAATVSEPADAAYLAAWIEQQRGGRCPAADPGVCAATAEVIDSRLGQLAGQYAEREEDAFESLLDDGQGLPRLAAMVSFEQEFRRRYAALAAHDGFSDGVERRRKVRQKQQLRLEDKLLALAAEADTTTQLRDLESTYFVDDDIAALETLVATLDQRMQTRRPFAALPAGAYLNALYNRDYTRLRELDRRYLAGIMPLARFGAAQLAELGPLFDAVLGRPGGDTAEEVATAMYNLTALYAVIGTWLVEYQDRYEPCLQPDARTFTITQRTDVVTTDGFGNEISRRKGWTTQDSYRINPEFAPQFQALFDTATGSAQAQFLDLLLNDSQIAVLRRGTRRLMREFDCTAPEVKQLEQGMLAYDREVRRRARG